MKSTITCILVLLAVACTRARNVNYPASLPGISSPSFPSGQWNTQDEIGQASFGYAYPGQARSKRQLPDCETNFGNGFPIVNEKFNYSMYTSEEETGRNQYPFMAALLKYDETSRRYKLACGGSLISATKILTAAHCVIQNDTIPAFDKWLVKLGVHFLNETADDAEVTSRINQIDIHENYDQLTKFHDIAIVTLESPVKFTDRISTVCLPKECHSVANLLSSVSTRTLQWGSKAKGERNSDALHHVHATAMDNDYCNYLATSYYGHEKQMKVADHMVCALSTTAGDSYRQIYEGGPVIIEKDTRRNEECPWLQFGIIVRKGPNQSDNDIYTRLTSFWTWIDDKVNP
ncbi:chymotrypsin-1-like isoform X2 [Daphnia pulex]|uniref:chymotrypsin-1-like isoform X2 n=1 Tax=Daphnia pulex TaxID=6669 RepID=UPI001EDCF033|nr:chymotrypsin-1-like isoform X2 [Daphnia pulex]